MKSQQMMENLVCNHPLPLYCRNVHDEHICIHIEREREMYRIIVCFLLKQEMNDASCP